MSQQCQTARFLALSPSDITAKDPKTRSKFSYNREILLSIAKLDIIELPREVYQSISRVFEDACSFLQPPIGDSDSRCDKSTAPQLSSLNLHNVNNLLHRSEKAYCPPRRYKALPPSSRDNNDLCINETSGSSVCTSQEKVNLERWRKALNEEKLYAEIVGWPKEDQCHFKEQIEESSTSNNLQSTSNTITKQLDASHQPSPIERTLKNTKKHSTQDQTLPGVTTDNTFNLREKSVNNNNAFQHLTSLLEKGENNLEESKACSDSDVGISDITPNIVGCQKKSCAPGLLTQEECGNLENGFKAVHEKAGMELQLSNTSDCVHCEDDLKQVDSVSMKQSPSSPFFDHQQELELYSELCLPDEDSLITFDDESSGSPRDMVEKLVESVLNEDLEEPQVTFCHSRQPLQSFTQFSPYQDTTMDLSSFSSLTLESQSFPPSHDNKMKSFDHGANHHIAMFPTTANPDKLLNPHFYYGSQTWQTQNPPHLVAPQNLNLTQDCTIGYYGRKL